jgi:hypothetical protein
MIARALVEPDPIPLSRVSRERILNDAMGWPVDDLHIDRMFDIAIANSACPGA